jgi:hypothetical protein
MLAITHANWDEAKTTLALDIKEAEKCLMDLARLVKLYR